SPHQFLEVVYNRRFELLMLFMLFLFVIFVGAIAIYIIEESINSKINSLLDALYWSYITITTVGYGDITPLSTGGKVISFIIVLLGLTIISFGTSVIVTAFMEKLHTIKEESMANHLLAHDDYYIVCGYGQLTKVLAASLAQEGKEFLILDNSEKNVKNAIDDGYSAILDDPARYDVLKRFYTSGSNIIVLALTGSDVENIYISINAKSISKDIFVVARASRKEMREKYIRAGADRVLLPNDLAAFMMEASVVKPVMYKAINALLNFKEIASLDELYIDKDSAIVNLPLEEAKFNLYRIVVLGIQRGLEGEFIFNPPDDYILKAGDIVIVTSHSRYIEHFKLTHNLKRNIWSR
ncbi:MAG TPA: potassium channel protein, partial [Nitratifractor sp.]|nr:potassium channel protein [Nitratifractor sp.]